MKYQISIHFPIEEKINEIKYRLTLKYSGKTVSEDEIEKITEDVKREIAESVSIVAIPLA